MVAATLDQPAAKASRRPTLGNFAHVSLPCRDIAEGKKFYAEVLGGKIRVDTPTFAAFMFGEIEIGIGTKGCTFMEPSNEYPHIAFYCDASTLVAMKAWLTACGIPTSNLWTRQGKETLMFFRDPSGNTANGDVHLINTKGVLARSNGPFVGAIGVEVLEVPYRPVGQHEHVAGRVGVQVEQTEAVGATPKDERLVVGTIGHSS